MPEQTTKVADMKRIAIHWFRQDLRLHDNPALAAATDADEVYPVFIFDGKVASTENSMFLRIRFLHECLTDLDTQFTELGGRLYTFQGETIPTLRHLFKEWGVTTLTYQVEPEALWQSRDDSVKELCKEMDVEVQTFIGHTLWDPHRVIEKNGGEPPLTYAIFNHVTEVLGPPAKPVEQPKFKNEQLVIAENFERFELPTYEKLGFAEESQGPDKRINKWIGGEMTALTLFNLRLAEERVAFSSGFVLPNQYIPDLCSPPKSLSAHLKFGCLSVRRFYWAIQDLYKKVVKGENSLPISGIVAQLMWREYFYTMAAENLNYGQIAENPICLPIPWYEDKNTEDKIEFGQTGYPFIDAIMNQLRSEGWVHHVGRHMLASYITRGDLWLSWEVGVRIFEKYLLDYDWSICAGNWMWVSSSAFEKALDCPKCFDPVKYGLRMDPGGVYIRRYVPALKKMPLKYLFSPWLAPQKIQKESGCVVGKDYPARLNDHKEASRENSLKMERIRHNLTDRLNNHCAPSNDEELRQFVWLPDHMAMGAKCTGDSMCEGMAGL